MVLLPRSFYCLKMKVSCHEAFTGIMESLILKLLAREHHIM